MKKETVAYLVSQNPYGYRHGKENPKVIGLVKYTPRNLEERACLKVEYESDHKVDFIPLSEIVNGNWMII